MLHSTDRRLIPPATQAKIKQESIRKSEFNSHKRVDFVVSYFFGKNFTNGDQNCRGSSTPYSTEKPSKSKTKNKKQTPTDVSAVIDRNIPPSNPPGIWTCLFYGSWSYVSTPEEIKKCPYYSSSSTILLKQVCQTGFNEQRENAISQGSALKVVEEKLYKYGKLMASNTIKPYWESTVAMYNINKTIVQRGWILK